MIGGEKNKDHQKFLFSFFELSNKKVISLMIAEYWDNGKLINDEYDSFFTNHQFDQPWDEWWESAFKDNLKSTDSETHKYIKSFFKKNHYPNRYDKTKIIKY